MSKKESIFGSLFGPKWKDNYYENMIEYQSAFLQKHGYIGPERHAPMDDHGLAKDFYTYFMANPELKSFSQRKVAELAAGHMMGLGLYLATQETASLLAKEGFTPEIIEVTQKRYHRRWPLDIVLLEQTPEGKEQFVNAVKVITREYYKNLGRKWTAETMWASAKTFFEAGIETGRHLCPNIWGE